MSWRKAGIATAILLGLAAGAFAQLEGQTVKVKVIGISDEGRINLSIKRALEPQKPESAPRSRDAQPKREKPARTPVPPAASTSGNMDFEDRLKKFMQESDSRIADNRMYSEHRQRTRRK